MQRIDKYVDLLWYIRKEGYGQEEIARCIDRSVSYVSSRFNLKNGWGFDIEEAYKILEFLKLPKSELYKYFPPGGEYVYCPDAS